MQASEASGRRQTLVTEPPSGLVVFAFRSVGQLERWSSPQCPYSLVFARGSLLFFCFWVAWFALLCSRQMRFPAEGSLLRFRGGYYVRLRCVGYHNAPFVSGAVARAGTLPVRDCCSARAGELRADGARVRMLSTLVACDFGRRHALAGLPLDPHWQAGTGALRSGHCILLTTPATCANDSA